jgi:hypothetical protein
MSSAQLRALVAQAKRVLGGEPFEVPATTTSITLRNKRSGKGYSFDQWLFNIGGVADYHTRRAWSSPDKSGVPMQGLYYPSDAFADDARRIIPALLQRGWTVVEGPDWK